MNAHRLWTGSLLIAAAALTQTIIGGSWSLALLVALGILLVLSSFSPERAAQ